MSIALVCCSHCFGTKSRLLHSTARYPATTRQLQKGWVEIEAMRSANPFIVNTADDELRQVTLKVLTSSNALVCRRSIFISFVCEPSLLLKNLIVFRDGVLLDGRTRGNGSSYRADAFGRVRSVSGRTFIANMTEGDWTGYTIATDEASYDVTLEVSKVSRLCHVKHGVWILFLNP